MDRRPPVAGCRAAAFAAALFAITLNFLQPLAHAALLRDSGPIAAASLWGAVCTDAGSQDDEPGRLPVAAKIHECCLGLAHTAALAEPPIAFVLNDLRVEAIQFTAQTDSVAAVGIRDGPGQPRGPPPLT